MADLTNADFMSPYEVQKYLSGVIKGNTSPSQTWLQDKFGNRDVTEEPTFNVDREADQKNVMGQYVHPKADAGYIQLPDFGTQEMRFAYAKEGIQSDDFISLNQRQLGDAFGQIDVNSNDARNLAKKLSNALAAFANLKEAAARDILIYGTHTATSPKFAPVAWNFNRTVVTTDAGYLTGIVPQIDLTTLNGNGGVGKRAWGSTGGTVVPTPVKDLIKIVNTARRRGLPIDSILMSGNAYEAFEADIIANYTKAYDMTQLVEARIVAQILPKVEKYQTLNFRRSFPVGDGTYVDIYTYDAVYNDRITGVQTKYVPDGYVVSIPSPNNQLIRYGRILHRKARWGAMPIWVNTWTDSKTGEIEQELHTSYVMAPWDVNSVVSWKVM